MVGHDSTDYRHARLHSINIYNKYSHTIYDYLYLYLHILKNEVFILLFIYRIKQTRELCLIIKFYKNCLFIIVIFVTLFTK